MKQSERSPSSAIVVPRPKLGVRFDTSPAPAALVAHGHRTIAEVDANGVEGLSLAEAARSLGLGIAEVRTWLTNRGYHFRGGVVQRVQSASSIQDAISDRIAAAPPSAPCVRCGAARGCEHRS